MTGSSDELGERSGGTGEAERSDAAGVTTISESGVQVQRTTRRIRDTVAVTLTIQSHQSVPVLLRIVDVLTDGRSILGTAEMAGDPQFHGDGHLEYLQLLEANETVRVSYAVDDDGGDVADPRTTIAAVVPMTGVTDVDRESAFLWVTDDEMVPVGCDRFLANEVDWQEGPTGTAIPTTDVIVVGNRRAEQVGVPFDPTPAELQSSRDLPAIGIEARRGFRDGVVRTVVRARSRGHRVYVVPADDRSAELTRIAGSLGATVLSVPDANATEVERRLAVTRAANEAGYPGVVFQTVSASPIDYERTLAVFEVGDYEVDAVPASWSEPRDHPHVVAAIPAYNAADSVGHVVELARRYADVVLVVNDGSADETGEVARAAGAIVVDHERNRGYGGALKTAFREAASLDADYLVTLDADGQHDPADIPRLVEAQKSDGTDIVIGSRYARDTETDLPFVRRVGLGIINSMTNLSIGRLRPRSWIRDTQSGYRSYNRSAIASLAEDAYISDGMSASTDIIYHATHEGYTFGEVGTTISYAVERASTQDPFTHGYGLLRNIAITMQVTHPFTTLGMLGGFVAAVGAGVALDGLEAGFETGSIPFGQTYAGIITTVLGTLLVTVAIGYHVNFTGNVYQRPRKR